MTEDAVAVEQVVALAAHSRDELLLRLDEGADSVGEGPWRLAVVEPTSERLAAARAAVATGEEQRGRDGIFFASSGLVVEGAKVAFVFPGLEATFEPRVDDVARSFGWPVPEYSREPDVATRALEMIAVARLQHHALQELGVQPDVIAGHSLGEWSGIIAAGMLPEAAVDEFIAAVQVDDVDVPVAACAVVSCSADQARFGIDALTDTFVTHDNCPHQAVICGPENQLGVALRHLREQGVRSQMLPGTSGGFHSPHFSGVAGKYRAALESLPFRRPTVPLWSATTCAPFPEDLSAFRHLAVRHLAEPVRFRELVLALYEFGVRVFVQVGTGNAVAFVDDSLSGARHHAIAVNVPERSGLAQLRRAAAALFVEGTAVRLHRLGIGPPHAAEEPAPAPLDSAPALERHLVLAEFEATTQALRESYESVFRAFASGASRPHLDVAPASTRRLAERRTMSVAEHPELVDHCLVRQPEAWPNIGDRYPVVPLAMSISLLVDAARALVPNRVALAVEGVRARSWFAAAPPAEIEVRAEYDGHARVDVSLGSYAEGTVVVADDFPAPPAARQWAAGEEQALPVTAESAYRDGWLFHGRRYQGIAALGSMGNQGISGTLRALPAKGALLDAAGQLFGLWIMASTDADRLAMPVAIERVEFFGPDPRLYERLQCRVFVRHVRSREVDADFELVHDGRVWARVTGWQKWRFGSDQGLWRVVLTPERSLFGEAHPDGYIVVDGSRLTEPSRAYLARRYLCERERAELEVLPQPQRTPWLYGRVAAKDAVRHFLFERGCPSLFPIEIEIDNAPDGRPIVFGPFVEDLRISLAHKRDLAVAICQESADPGIDLEQVAVRGDGFAVLAFSRAELTLLPTGDREQWLTRCWAAKEATGKARRSGVAPQPRRLPVTTIDGERIRVDGTWVETRAANGQVVAWTAG